jgi:hypothetical protein
MSSSTANFAAIDANRIASAKQVYGVAAHFANLHAAKPSERFGLTKCFNAILNKFYGDHDSHMTHGEVNDFRGYQVVPFEFLQLLRSPAAKKSKAVVTPIKASPAVRDAEIAEYVERTRPVGRPKGSKNKINANVARIDALEVRVEAMDGKLDQIVDILTAR